MNRGCMQCLGPWASKSWSCYKLDVIKSGLQKYLRRREQKKMVRCMVELDLFSHCGDKAKGIRTNMINRLKVMCYEELCFDQLGRFLQVMRKIDQWEASGRTNRKVLVEICMILTTSELLRLSSDIKNYYWKGVRRYGYGSINKNLKSDIRLALPYKKEKDSQDIIKDLANFIYFFNKKDDVAFYWLFEIILKASNGVKGHIRYRRKDCDYIIWEFLFDKAKHIPELTEALNYGLKEYFKKNRTLKGDRLVVIISCTLAVMHKNKLDFNPAKVKVTDAQVDKFYNLTQPLVVDDYVLDKHCAAGRRKGKTNIDFALEGSKVVRQNKTWFNKKYRDAYIEMKLKSCPKSKRSRSRARSQKSHKSPESKLKVIPFSKFKNVTCCSSKTCGGKAMCWSVEYQGKKLVLKEGRKSMNYNRDYMVLDNLKPLFGLNKIGMIRIIMNKVGVKKDKKKKTWCKNYKWIDKPNTVYTLMKKIKGEMLIKHKDRINTKELLKIGLFRGIFRVTDFNLRNIFITPDDKLYSIDEHNIGKRDTIFKKSEAKYFKSKSELDEVLRDLYKNKKQKIKAITKEMRKYNFSEELIKKVISNYENLQHDAKIKN